MKIFRPEPFGGVLYNPENLRFKLVSEIPDEEVLIKAPAKFVRKDILSAPVRAYFELTKKCNLACRHCFVSSSPKAEVGESTSNLKTVIDNLARNKVIDIQND